MVAHGLALGTPFRVDSKHWPFLCIGGTGTPDVDVDAPEAAQKSATGEGVVVAVIDDGVDFGHPDLAGHQWVNEGEVPNNNIDDDGNGYVDDVNGYDFANDDNTVHDALEDFHGTHVAGTIAASSDGNNVVGVAPNVEIMAVKFLGGPFGSLSAAIEAIEYAADNGAKISNNSWGYVGTPDPALRDAIEASGLLFVASAGNEHINNDTGLNIPEFGGRLRAYPVSYNLPNVLSVAAVNNTGKLAGFSNFGRKTVDVSAPGVGVLSTVPSVPQKPGLTLSTVGAGRALVAGFGLEEISGAEARADFAKKAMSTLGFCTDLTAENCPTVMEKVLLVDDDLSSTFPPEEAEFGPPDVRPEISAALRSTQNVDLDVFDVGAGDGPSFRLVMATGQPAPLTRGKTVTGDIVNADRAVTDTPPRITGFSPTGTTSDTTPTIRATVVDLQELLAKSDLEVSVDGDPRGNFSYNANSGALSLAGGRMKEGRHSVEITATDPQNLSTTKSWTFRVG